MDFWLQLSKLKADYSSLQDSAIQQISQVQYLSGLEV